MFCRAERAAPIICPEVLPNGSFLYSELERIKQIEIRTEKGGFFGTPGFSVEDTDAYISDLIAMIEKKIQ